MIAIAALRRLAATGAGLLLWARVSAEGAWVASALALVNNLLWLAEERLPALRCPRALNAVLLVNTGLIAWMASRDASCWGVAAACLSLAAWNAGLLEASWGVPPEPTARRYLRVLGLTAGAGCAAGFSAAALASVVSAGYLAAVVLMLAGGGLLVHLLARSGQRE